MFVGLGAVVVLGLGSRKYPALFPAVLDQYPGDALWALMVYLGWAFWRPRASRASIGVLAFSTSCLVECSQLYQADWLNVIRATTLGYLVLGSTFVWQDILAYAAGIVVGVVIDRRVFGAHTVEVGEGRLRRSAAGSSLDGLS
jgi:hypothetical protein